jgi:hypothetical protein
MGTAKRYTAAGGRRFAGVTASPGFLGYTLIAQKKDDVLSDKLSFAPLTSRQSGAIIYEVGRACQLCESNKSMPRPRPSRKEIEMYTKDKSNRITLRLNDEQFEFVKQNADFLGVSPSEFLRMVVNASMATTKTAISKIGEGLGRENDKTNCDDIV